MAMTIVVKMTINDVMAINGNDQCVMVSADSMKWCPIYCDDDDVPGR